MEYVTLNNELNMKKKVRILILFLAALMVTGLGGCENTAPQNSTIANDQSEEADTAEASTTVEAAQTEEQAVEPEPGS